MAVDTRMPTPALCLCTVLMFQATPKPEILCSNSSSRYSPNSPFEANLKILLSGLTSNTEIDYGFYNSSYGDSSTAYATGLCRADVKPDACRRCIANSSALLPKLCPYLPQAVGVDDECILHYADASVFGVQDDQYWIYSDDTNAPNWNKYEVVLNDVLEKLKDLAASGDSRRKFAAGNDKGIHAFVQCHPDLSEAQCEDCLEGAFSYIQTCCAGKAGGRVIVPSCNFRFENYRFYDASVDNSIAASSPPKSATSPHRPSNTTFSHGKSKTLQNVITIIVAMVAFTLILIFVYIYFNMMKRRKDIRGEDDVHNEIRPNDLLQFNFETIRVATNDFSNENKLGQGGFGQVYKIQISMHFWIGKGDTKL